MRHLRPTLVLVAALGLFSALAGGVAFGRRQADLAALPRSAPAFAAARPSLPPRDASLPGVAPTPVTLLLLTGPDQAAVAALIRREAPAQAWADAPLQPEPWSLPVRLAMALTGAAPETAGPDLFAAPGSPAAAILTNPDNVLRAAQVAGRAVACVRATDALVLLGETPCPALAASGARPTADLLLVVARAEDLSAPGWASLLPAGPSRPTLVVAESAPGVEPTWGHLWVGGPGVVTSAPAGPVARADVAATTAALLSVPPPGGPRGHVLDAWLPRPAAETSAAHLALLRGRVALLDRLLAGQPPGALAVQRLDSLRRTAAVAADDLRLGNPAGAERLLAPALDQADGLLAETDAARRDQGRTAWLLPVVLALLGLGGVLAWLVMGAPLAALGRRRLAGALALGGAAWLAGQGIAGLAGAWLPARWLPAASPLLVAQLVGAGAFAGIVAAVLAGLTFDRRAALPPLPPDRLFIPVPSVQLVQRLRAPSPGPRLVALGAVSALGGVAAAAAWGLALGWATGGPVAGWLALPPPDLLAAHLAGLLGLAGAGLATPLAPLLAWGAYRLRRRAGGNSRL